MEENFLDMGSSWLIWAWRGLVVADVFDDMRSTILALAVDRSSAMELLEEEFSDIVDLLRRKKPRELYRRLARSAAKLRRIALRMPLHEAPRVLLTGEVFARRDSFTNLEMVRHLADRGFVVSTNMLTEQIQYAGYLVRTGQSESNLNLFGRMSLRLSWAVMGFLEHKIKRILAASDLYEYEETDIDELMRYKNHLVTPNLVGEYDRIIGTMHRDALSIYCGVVSVGPFGCMQLRFAEAIAHTQTNVAAKRRAMVAAGEKPDVGEFRDDERIPFLSVESDGTPFPQLLQARFENFCLQASRVAERQGKRLDGLIEAAEVTSLPLGENGVSRDTLSGR
jgi:predicted nucleotide-binding protein (sugar kinase/HSP70/actin superfamily)